MLRDILPLDAFADEVIVALAGGEKTILAAGEWPVAAIAFSGHHLLLLRDHHHSLTLSLPTKQSWPLRMQTEWLAAKEAIKQAVLEYREQNVDAVSMADVIVALGTASWPANFPGTPVPSEAWLTKADGSGGTIGLFQEDKYVRLVIWVEADMRSKTISSIETLKSLGEWIQPHLVDQKKAAEAAAAEEARKKALPLPQLSDVMAVLRKGKRISTGGGRYSETYFIKNEKLRCEVFDEGHNEVFDATEKELLTSIGYHPDQFRDAL